MTVAALMSRSFDLRFVKPMLEARSPGLEVLVWPDPRCTDAEIAICWDAPRGIYAQMPRLKLVHSIAAGVDNVVDGQELGAVPVCRVVDPKLAEGMLQFVLWSVLLFHRQIDVALANQPKQQWFRPQQTPSSACRVGIMGLGEIGSVVAGFLPQLGYEVSGWSRTARTLPGVRTFSGEAGFQPFLNTTDILVCLLPLTEATRGILSRPTFDALPAGAALVHCGRGEHLVEDDLVDALARGQLRGAVVDVFAREPLAPEHPLWTTPGVVVTPHMATMATFDVVVDQVSRNIDRVLRGEPPLNTVDTARGY